MESNPAAFRSTGASVGDTGGGYDRATDSITFTRIGFTRYTGVSFGDVPESRFLTDGRKAGLPGSAVFYTHQFIAGTAGQVSFISTNTPSPAFTGWAHTIYHDLNCNGQIDVGESVLSNPIPVEAEQTVCLVIKESIPANAPINAQDRISVTASFMFANASPALAVSLVREDLTTVGSSTTAGLTLVKSVDKATAAPGEVITYTLTYANQSNDSLGNIAISDATPSFTTFVSAAYGPLPQNLAAAAITKPPVGTSGPLNWTFTGVLAPGSQGTVSFQVKVEKSE